MKGLGVGWMVLGLLLAACSSQETVSTANPVLDTGTPVPDGFAHVYTCGDGFEFTLWDEPGREWYFAPGLSVGVAPDTGDANGYLGDGVQVALGDGVASVEQQTAQHEECVRDGRKSVWETAKLRGFDFRATGNEPGWVLELRRKDVSFLAIDYGLVEFAFATPAPRVETGEGGERRTLYETSIDTNELVIEITPGPCEDSMSGELFETNVTVTLAARMFYGCGRALH